MESPMRALTVATLAFLASSAAAQSPNIVTVAGDGAPVYAGDGGPASAASLTYVWDIELDGRGNAYLYDERRIRRIDGATGIITTIAGGGSVPYPNDGLPGTSISIQGWALAIDADGNVYFSDESLHGARIRRLDAATGIVTTLAGNGDPAFVAASLFGPTYQVQAPSGDGGPAIDAWMQEINDIEIDAQGNLYYADARVVRRIEADCAAQASVYSALIAALDAIE